MKKVMTAEQSFNYSMNTYPSLYAADNIEQSQYKVYDHIFNVIGNGYRDLEEFIDAHKITKETKPFIDNFPQKYVEPGALYYAYTKMSKIGEGKDSFDMPDYDSILKEVFTKEEQKDHPEVVQFTNISKHTKKTPYPNFQKQYSMVWKMDMNQLDSSWTKAAIWYYEKTKEFFNSDETHLYHYAWPKDENKQKRLIGDFEKNFERYKKEGQTQEEFNAEITKAYGFEYKGDTAEFIQGKWNKELNRIHSFIDETLEKLHNDLSLRNVQEPKKKMKP
jgi:hypothetical protein